MLNYCKECIDQNKNLKISKDLEHIDIFIYICNINIKDK